MNDTEVKPASRVAAVRSPAAVMTAVALGVDQAVEEGGRVVIEPIEAKAHDLNALLDQMRSETFSEDIDFRPPRGRERSPKRALRSVFALTALARWVRKTARMLS